MYTVLAVSFGANLTFAAFLLIGAFGLIFGYYTVRGSGINNHPHNGSGGAPGAKLPDEFHQFADRQQHDADVRRAEHEARVAARQAYIEQYGEDALRHHLHLPHPHAPHLHLPHPHLRTHDGEAEPVSMRAPGDD